MGEPHFEEIEHTADWAIRVRGEHLSALFVNAAQAMLRLMGVELTSGASRASALELAADDSAGLLVTWLEELLFRLETAGVAAAEIDIHAISATGLRATLHEQRLARLARHIKAVTYHDLSVRETPQGVEATIVFDV